MNDRSATQAPTPSTPMVKAEAVHKSFGHIEVLKGISLEVQRGEVVCLLGVSGSGKSTFLRCINHLEKIDAGRLWVDGHMVGYKQVGERIHELRDHEICARRAEIGMVFQRFNLFGHMTALENVIEAPIRVAQLRVLGGAMSRVPADATAGTTKMTRQNSRKRSKPWSNLLNRIRRP